MSGFLRFLGVQRGEGALAGGLFSYSLLLGIGRVFILTASQALFLQFYPASDLAYVYMIAAVATIATSAAYLRLGRSLSPRNLILANLAFTVAVTLALRLLFGTTESGWPAMALSAWFHVMFALSSFAFWGAATQVVDIRQGKRLFPLATTGDVVAFSLGGFLILQTVDSLGTENLLWIGAIGFGLSIGAFLFTLSRSSVERSGTKRDAGKPSGSDAVAWSSPYIRLMMAYFILAAVVFILLDNAFNDVAQRRFDGATELARFFATYSAIAAIVNFFFRSLAAGRLVRRFGLIFGLAVLPAVVGLGAATIGFAGTLLPGLAFVFWLTVVTRLSDKVLRGVQYSSMATLYQPLGDKGAAVQTTMDGIIDSAAIGLTGAALLGLNSLFEITAVELSFLLLGCCALWVLVAVRLKREFVEILGGALHRRRLSGESIDVGEEALEVVRNQLESEYPEQVVYAVRLLVEAEHPGLADALVELLDHASEDVRIEALRSIETLDWQPEVSEADRALPDPTLERLRAACLGILRDPRASGELRAAAARTVAQLPGDCPDEVMDALSSDEPELRRGAMVGLLRSGSIDGIVQAGAALLQDLGSDDPGERSAGANVLRDAAIPSFFRQGLDLLDDPDPAVRARGVEAAAAMDHAALWPRVVEQLRDHALAPIASEALLGAGPAAIPFLVRAFDERPEDRHFRLTTLRILGLSGGSGAIEALMPWIGVADREERTAVLSALSHFAFEPAGEQVDALAVRLDVELADAAESFAALADVALVGGSETDGPEVLEAGGALRAALEDEIDGTRHRIFLILSLLRPGGELLTAWENYATGSRERRAYALELLDSHLTSEERGRIFPALDELAVEERLQALSRSGDTHLLGAGERLERLAIQQDLGAWTRLCAQRAGALVEAGTPALSAPEVELVDWTSRLRRVELFDELPSAVLARAVPKLRHVAIEPDREVFRKGDVGDGMYLILEGRVRVHDGGRELAVLGPDKIFGEFTVLQRMPRTASVTTIEGSRLLRFSQEDLQALMSEHVGVARALIRVILRRLRRNRELAASADAGSEGAAVAGSE